MLRGSTTFPNGMRLKYLPFAVGHIRMHVGQASQSICMTAQLLILGYFVTLTMRLLQCILDLLHSLFTTLELRPNNFRYYDRSKVQWNINTVPLQLRIPGRDEKTSFLPQRGHDNMDHFIPKQLLDFDISSNRDLLKIFHSYCRDMGIFTPDCDKIGILNADVNIYLRLMKVTNNCF